jgi:hypothetical protein
MAKTMRVEWLGKADGVGADDVPWAFGQSRQRSGAVLAWGHYANAREVPGEDVEACEHGLSWHRGLRELAAGLRCVAECYAAQGDARDAATLLALAGEAEAEDGRH